MSSVVTKWPLLVGMASQSVLVYWDLQPCKLEDKGCPVSLFFLQTVARHGALHTIGVKKCCWPNVWVFQSFGMHIAAYALFMFETQTALILMFCGFWIPFTALSSFRLITIMGRAPLAFWRLRWRKLKIRKDRKGQSLLEKNPLVS